MKKKKYIYHLNIYILIYIFKYSSCVSSNVIRWKSDVFSIYIFAFLNYKISRVFPYLGKTKLEEFQTYIIKVENIIYFTLSTCIRHFSMNRLFLQ